MVGEVIDLNERRNDDSLVCPRCGGAWFKSAGIVLDKTWHVTGYALPLVCGDEDCGFQFRSTQSER